LPAVVCAFVFVFYAVALIVNLVMMKTEDHLRMTQYGNTETNQTLTVVGESSFSFAEFCFCCLLKE